MYLGTQRRFDKLLLSIITRNTVACKFSHNSFSYKGQFYNGEMTVPRYKNQRLMPELHTVMDEYIAEGTDIKLNEEPYVLGFFNKMLNLTSSIDDYLAILPDCMHRAIHTLNIEPQFRLPRELSDDQVAQFKQEHASWILLLKKRMVLDLVL